MRPKRDYAKKIPPPRPDYKHDVMWASPTRINSIADNKHADDMAKEMRDNPELLRRLVWEDMIQDSIRRYTRTTASYKAKHLELVKPHNAHVCCINTHYLQKKGVSMTHRYSTTNRKRFSRGLATRPDPTVAARRAEDERAACEPFQSEGGA